MQSQQTNENGDEELRAILELKVTIAEIKN